MQAAAKSYFQTQVTTTTQGDLLIMLFDGALKFLHQAKEKIAERNYAQKGILISKAIDILSELQGSLNAKKGGELADRLQKLYFYCNSRLVMANLKLDVARIDEVIDILGGLREAFNEANAKVGSKAVPVSASQSAPRLAPAGSAPTATVSSSAYSLSAQAAGVPPRPTGLPTPAIATAPKAQPALPTPALAVVRPAGQDAAPAADAPAASIPSEAPEAAPAPRPLAFETVVTPTKAPVRRAMAAYAAVHTTE